MRPIVFLIKDTTCTASTQCGVVVNHALISSGVDSTIRYSVEDIKDSTVVIFKHILSDIEISILKNNNNKIVMDVVDEFIRPGTNVLGLYDYSKLDGIITRVKKVLEEYALPTHLVVEYIPHHWDIRLQDVAVEHTNINYKPVLISNDVRDMAHLEYLSKNNLLDFHMNFGFNTFSDYIDTFLRYNIHYNVRTTDSLAYKFKPATKLVTAAALNTPLLTNYDWALQDLLPEDYPFLVQDTSLPSILNAINNVKEVSASQYNYALDILAEVKYKTALVNLIPAYINFYKQF